MKRLILTFIILICIFVFGIGTIIYSLDIKDEITTSLNLSVSLVNQNKVSQAQTKIKSISKKWQVYRQYLVLFVRHHDVEELNLILSQLEQYLKDNELTLFRAETKKANSLIEEIATSEIPTLKNIF